MKLKKDDFLSITSRVSQHHTSEKFFFLISNIKFFFKNIAQYIGNVQKGKNIKKPNYNDVATQEGKYKKKMVKKDTIREE